MFACRNEARQQPVGSLRLPSQGARRRLPELPLPLRKHVAAAPVPNLGRPAGSRRCHGLACYSSYGYGPADRCFRRAVTCAVA